MTDESGEGTARAPCEIGVECGEIIAAGGQCVVKRVSEAPALPHLPGCRDNCRLLAYDGIFQ